MRPLLHQALPVPLSSCRAEGEGEGKRNHSVFLRDQKESLKEKAQEQRIFTEEFWRGREEVQGEAVKQGENGTGKKGSKVILF